MIVGRHRVILKIGLRHLWRPFLKMAVKEVTKIQKMAHFPYFSMNLGKQYMNIMFFDITESKSCIENFNMAAVFKMAAKMAAKQVTKIQKMAYFPYFSMNLGMHYMNLMFFDITESKSCIENFNMAAVFKMAAKLAAKIYKTP